ncbi:MAG: hypothetical protein NT062_18805, partial [Proteobacteria bacterium]|nr:hypothetical protein [Pseudomonadota bacterium]
MVHRRALPFALLLTLVVGACGRTPAPPLAELVKAEGPVDRQPGTAQAAWTGAAIGTGFLIGDAARTADGGAQLALAGGQATIAMLPRTILRFGRGKGNASKLAVETGAIDLAGSGSYALDIGDLKLTNNARVHVTANGKGASTLELTLGDAQVTSSSGQTIELALGTTIDLALDLPATADAGVARADAVADAELEIDAAPPAVGAATIAVTGKKAEILDANATWRPVPEGVTTIARGARLRIGAGTTATVTAGGATLELGSGAKFAIAQDDTITIE